MKIRGLVTYCAPQSLTSFASSKDELLLNGVEIELRRFREIHRNSWPLAVALDVALIFRLIFGAWDFVILNSGASLLVRPRLLRLCLAIAQRKNLACFLLWRNADEKFRNIRSELGADRFNELLSILANPRIEHLAISDRTGQEIKDRLKVKEVTNIRNCRRMPSVFLDAFPPKLPPTVLNVASVRHRKGPDLFVSIAIKSCTLSSSIVFKWIGGRPGDELQELIDKSGYSDRINFIEHVAEPYQYMQDAYCLMLTSREEAFGLVVAEAMACSRTTICFSNTGAAEVAGDTGHVFDIQNEDAVVNFLLSHTKLSPLEAINASAAQRYQAIYSPRGYAEHLSKFLLQRVESHRSSSK